MKPPPPTHTPFLSLTLWASVSLSPGRARTDARIHSRAYSKVKDVWPSNTLTKSALTHATWTFAT